MPRSSSLPPEMRAAVGGKRRPRVDRAHAIFASGTKTLKAIAQALVDEFSISLDVAKHDVGDMVREMAAEQFELRGQYKTLAIGNLEALFHAAMAAGKYGPALRALELHAKITGLLLDHPAAEPEKPRVDLTVLAPEQRAQFREHLSLVGRAQIANAKSEAQA